jgi:hypothetical protein
VQGSDVRHNVGVDVSEPRSAENQPSTRASGA